MNKPVKLLIAVVGCELVGLASTPLTIAAIETWYKTLNKPFFSPPNWIFSPVWALLYFMMGAAAYFVWNKGLKNKKVRIALTIFMIQLMLNFLWSLIFFGLRSPILALVDIIVLLSAILVTAMMFYGISRSAAYLLIPYLLWVSFAMLLNLGIVVLNP